MNITNVLNEKNVEGNIIKLIGEDNHVSYYSIKLVDYRNEIIFKVYTFDKEYTLYEVGRNFVQAYEELFDTSKLYRVMILPFHMVGFNMDNCKIKYCNFNLYEYETLFKKNDKACVYLKSVYFENNGTSFNFLLESYDEESDLSKDEVYDYCKEYIRDTIQELEDLFHIPFGYTECYF